MADAQEFIVTDDGGHQHVFPAGTTPEDAIKAVRETNMSRGLAATGKPVAGTDIDAQGEAGFRRGLQNEGNEAASTAQAMIDAGKGYAKGILPGAFHGAVETLKLPFTLIKMAVGDTADLLTDPVGTLTKARDAMKDAPAATVKAFNDAINLAATNPEAYGKAVGELTGTVEGGIATGAGINAAKGPLARGSGRALVAAADHPAVARLTGGALLGHGVLKGDPVTAAAGIATMSAPAIAKRAGNKLRELGGEDLSERLPSGAREIDGGRAVERPSAIRSQAPRGVSPAKVPYGGGQPPAPAETPTKLDAARGLSGAREIDAGVVEGLPGGQTPAETPGAVRVPYGVPEPAPYRASAKAAVKADDAAALAAEEEAANQAALAEIERQKAGRTASEPKIRETTNATDEAGRKVSSSRTFDTAEPEPPVTPEGGFSAEERAALKKQGFTDETIGRIEAQRAVKSAPPAGAIRIAPPAPAAASPLSAIEGGADLPGFEVVGDESGTTVNASGAPGGGSAEEIARAASEKNRGVVRVKVDAGGNVQPVVGVNSQDVEPPKGGAIALQDADGNLTPEKGTLPRSASTTPAEPAAKPVIRVGAKGSLNVLPPIKNVPEDLEGLWTKHGSEEAGKLFAKANPGSFPKNLDPKTRTNLIREAMATKYNRYDAGGLLPESAQGTIDTALQGMASDGEKRAYLLKAPNAAAFNYIWHILRAGGE